ncbi:hypothetical protein B0G75_13134 [Paraburkholderia sp. BL18I3N2]|nr:hypothetical protein B0G75_13134 [Paraburkholderia sp. BL18I3N2]
MIRDPAMSGQLVLPMSDDHSARPFTDNSLASSFARSYAGVVLFLAMANEGSFTMGVTVSALAAPPSAETCRNSKRS